MFFFFCFFINHAKGQRDSLSSDITTLFFIATLNVTCQIRFVSLFTEITNFHCKFSGHEFRFSLKLQGRTKSLIVYASWQHQFNHLTDLELRLQQTANARGKVTLHLPLAFFSFQVKLSERFSVRIKGQNSFARPSFVYFFFSRNTNVSLTFAVCYKCDSKSLYCAWFLLL